MNLLKSTLATVGNAATSTASSLSGLKTYIGAALLALLGLWRIWNGEGEDGFKLLLEAMTLAGLRHAVAKNGNGH